MIGPGQGHITELDGLRGIACLGIVISHCIGSIIGATDVVLWPQAIWLTLKNFLWGGVDLFFVLSGFLIGGILIDNRGTQNFFAAFWTRRVARILPVLFIVVATYSLLLAVRPYIDAPFLDFWLLKAPVYSPLWYLTFTQTIPMAMTGWGPQWLAVTWSLAIEEQFYLFFPFLVYLLPRRQLAVVMIAFVVFCPILRGLIHHYVAWSVSYILLPCRMDSLSIGVLVAIAVRNPRILARLREYRRPLDAVMGTFALLLVGYNFELGRLAIKPISSLAADMVFTLNHSVLALFFALCLLRIFLYPRGLYHRFLAWKPLTWLGLVSYGLYMYHQPVNGLVHGLLFRDEPRVGSWLELIVALLVISTAIVLAALSYRFVEMPIRRVAQRVNFRRPVDPNPQAQMTPATTAN
jgi:peptidoglycan/LPS O-acetylase OafA/YrhL